MTKERIEEKTVIDQAQLDEIVAKHEAFKGGRANGARAVLRHYDITGLDLSKQ